MEKEEFQENINKYLKEINIHLEKRKIDQFYTYMTLLLEWNKKINLTAIIEPEEIIIKHFVDSLTIEKEIPKNSKIVDIGTGAGFPGIPLKIYRDDIEVTLIDSLNKRIKFLNEVINKLELKGIEAIHSRAEEIGKNKKYREQFDISTSRAVANLSTLSEYIIPLVKQGGKAIAMKGSDIKEELENAKNAIKELGGKIEKDEGLLLPKTEIKRHLIIIKKIKNTNDKYPRKPGIPAKEPIK